MLRAILYVILYCGEATIVEVNSVNAHALSEVNTFQVRPLTLRPAVVDLETRLDIIPEEMSKPWKAILREYLAQGMRLRQSIMKDSYVGPGSPERGQKNSSVSEPWKKKIIIL